MTLTAASPIPLSVLHTLAGELVSLLDMFIDDLAPMSKTLDPLPQLAIFRAEIASELLPGVEIDRPALKAECLDLALLLASKSFSEAGDLRMRTMLLATSLAGGG
jgi:hypothetical protein